MEFLKKKEINETHLRVLNSQDLNERAPSALVLAEGPLEGQNLVKTVAELTELPAPWIQQEMNQLLGASGHESESLTLEQLRAAMLEYLEMVQKSMESEFAQAESASDPSKVDPTQEKDFSISNSPIILK